MSSKLDKAMKADLDLQETFKYIITYYVAKNSANFCTIWVEPVTNNNTQLVHSFVIIVLYVVPYL